MKTARGLAAIVLLASLFAPELARYRSERVLRYADLALRYALRHPSETPDLSSTLTRFAVAVPAVASALPGDPRPWILGGSVRLILRQPDLAIADYQESLERGERAETDLNLGRAYTELGDRRKTGVAFVRAAWISPVIVSSIPPDVRSAVENTLAVLKARLESGELRAPPARP